MKFGNYGSYKPHVNFYEKKIGSQQKKNFSESCFRKYASPYYCESKSDKNLEKIYFPCPVDEILTGEITDFYIEFLKNILPPGIFSSRRMKEKNPKPGHSDQKVVFILFTAKSKIIGTQNIAFCLSSFRLLLEFPEIIKNFYKNRTNNLEQNFLIFQESHSVDVMYQNLFGHGLKIGGNSTISLTIFQERYNLAKQASVQSFLAV